MDATTQALIATVAAAIAALAATIAAVAGVVAVIYARRSLREGEELLSEIRRLREGAQAEADRTISELRQLQQASLAETQAHLASTLVLNMILAEAQAARELDLLRGIASEVFRVTAAIRGVRDSSVSWHAFQDAQELLGAQVASLPETQLPECRYLASAHANPKSGDNPETRATIEIQQAIALARSRLADATAAASEQVSKLSSPLIYPPT